MDLKALADSQLAIVLCYCFSFGLWGILFALDFISPNWRTIHDTRVSGIIHLFFSTILLAVAVFYLIVQRAAGDYKEMMVACIAAIVAVCYILRTISGLAQLRAYSVWCAKAVHKLYELNSVDEVYGNDLREHEDWLYQDMGKFEETETVAGLKIFHVPVEACIPRSLSVPMDSFLGVNEVAKFIDTRMLVNSQVIDNELFGRELPVRLCFPRCGILIGLWNALCLRFDDWLCSRNIVRCSFRWTIAVLSHFGQHWVHCNKPASFPRANVKLHLPYHMAVPKKFHAVIRAYQNSLTNDALFYNGGALDNVDIYLRNERPEIDLSKRHMESLRNLDTKQVLYFLALIAQNGNTTDIPMEPVGERKSLLRRWKKCTE